MDASVNSWEATFSLSDHDRERALRSSRLRHTHSSCEAKTSRKTPIGKSQDDDATHHVEEPMSKTYHIQRRQKSTSDTSFDRNPELSISPQTKPPMRVSRSTMLRTKNVNDGDGSSSMAATTRKTSTVLSFQKKRKGSVEIIDPVYNYAMLPPRLGADFFHCDAVELAQKLLGKFLRRDDVVLQITEVEAYRPNDSACHARFGVTPRTAAMFGPGGHAYVYLCYGLHVMLNIVADVEGVGAAVLIRSCAPMAGLETIQSRRGMQSSKPVLLAGPGKIGQALGITTEWSNHPLYVAGGLELLDGSAPDKVLVGPRVGIEYANSADVAALWRFAIADTPWISAPRDALALPPQDSS